MNPLVSVVIPTYMRTQCLEKALKSVLSQTYTNLEVILVDSSPSPKSKDFFKPFLSLNLFYDHCSIRRGAPRARNTGINHAKGEYIAFLDDDDTWEPTKIEKQVKAIKNQKDVSLVVCYSHDLRFGMERINKPPTTVSHRTIVKSFNLSSTTSYFVPRHLLEKVKERDGYYFDETLPAEQEYDLAIRLTQDGTHAICVPEALITQNSTKGQISENWTRKIKGKLSMYKKHHHKFKAIDHIKTVGVTFLFMLGYIVGNKIYKIIIPIKEMYET